MENLKIQVSDLAKSVDEIDIKLTFTEATDVKLAKFPGSLKSKCFADLIFPTEAARKKALAKNGIKICGREAILSIVDGPNNTSLYLKISGIPVDATISQIQDYFSPLCADHVPPKVVLPSPRRGYAFLFCKCLEDYEACLGCDQCEFMFRVMTVQAGGFKGRKGQREHVGGV